MDTVHDRCHDPRGPSGTSERPGSGRASALASHIRCFFGGYYFCRLSHLMRIRDGMRTVAAVEALQPRKIWDLTLACSSA